MKRSTYPIIFILVVFSAIGGFSLGAATRLSLIDVVLSLAPTAPILPEANILVLGTDDEFGKRSDTLMVLHINPAKKEAALISIPRDTLTVIPDRGLDKVNHAYAFGGIDLACKTVENFLHITIPYYVTVNYAGIEKLINEVGGVYINVEKRMYYVDYAADLHIDLQPGLQCLNGEQAMGYLRFRHSDNDFARIGRQQNFLKSMAAQLMRRENIVRSPALFLNMLSCVETNLNSREILGLALTLRGAFETGSVYMTMLPGTDVMVDGVYYWKPDELGLQRIVDQYILGKRLASSG